MMRSASGDTPSRSGTASMRAAPEDRLLSDSGWAGIARDVMHRTGLCPRGEEDDAVRWIAIRHGPDHIHLVGDAGPPGPDPAPACKRALPGPRCLPGRRGELRAAVHRPGRPHRGPPPTRAETGKAARHDRASQPGSPCAATSPPPPLPRQHHRVLRQAGPGRGAGPLRYSTRTPARSPGTPSPSPATPPRTANRSGTEAASSPRPVLAQAPAAMDPPGPARLPADTRRGRRAVGVRRPYRRRRHRPDQVLHRDREPDRRRRRRVRRRRRAACGRRCARQPRPCARPPTITAAPPASPSGGYPRSTPTGNQLRHAARLISAYAYLTQDR